MIVLDDARPRARVEHRCGECSRIIEVGEIYCRQRSIGDDGPYVWKACIQCAAFLHDLWAADIRGDDGYSYPSMFDLDWHDIASWGEVWLRRVALCRRKWRRRGSLVEYPAAPPTEVAA